MLRYREPGEECTTMRKQILIAGKDLANFQSIRNYMEIENIDVFYTNSIVNALEFVFEQEYCLVIIAIRPSEKRIWKYSASLGILKKCQSLFSLTG